MAFHEDFATANPSTIDALVVATTKFLLAEM